MGRRQGSDLCLQSFRALMVSAWKERKFGLVEDKGLIWVSQGFGSVMVEALKERYLGK